MKIQTLLLTLITSCSISACSFLNFWGGEPEKPKIDDKTLCSSKKEIITNHTYIPSFEACKRLSELGDLNATYVLGLLYTDTEILTSFLDPATRVDEGIAMVKKAADGGVTAAQKTLGTYYADEKGNYQEAAVYLQKAADRGDTDALIDLGTVYENLEQCTDAVKTYQKEIAKNGKNADGYFYLSLLYVSGCKDLKKDLNNACGYFALAQESQIKNTILQVLEYESQTGAAKNKNSVTNALKVIHEYEVKNPQKCQAAKIKLTK